MQSEKYNILTKLHLLTASKNGKFICPACKKNDFAVNKKNGSYGCFSGDCDPKDIRAAIDKLEGKTFDPKSKVVDRPIKSTRPKSETPHDYPRRDGSNLVRTTRVDDGKGGKSFYQSHWNGFAWAKGNPAEFRVNIPIYRYADVRQAIADGKLIFIVEGESCVDALWAIGIPATTTIGGAGKLGKYGDYTHDFDGGEFILAPDCDAVGVKHMAEFAALLGDKVRGYYLAGSNPNLWIEPCGGFDIKDDITDRGVDRDRILASVISADEYLKILNPELKKPVGRPRKPSPTPIDRDYRQLASELGIDLLESHYYRHGIPTSKQVKLELDLFAVCGDRLGFNEMSSEVELDRIRIDLNNAKSDVSRLLGSDHSTESCIMAFNQVAKNNKYSPVIDYLNSIRGLASKDFIHNIPQKYWNNTNDFQNYLFFKKLIATVARGMNPGCEDQSLLVLKGAQGARKSSLLQALASRDWFCGGGFDIESKDDLAKLSKFWILEMGEIDQLFSKKAAEQYKRFISEGFDVYRPPYGRMNVTKNRSSSLFATTNKSEFLNDPTGSRRYWIVECDETIDLESISRDRDLIWAAALDAYESGEIWRLTKAEEAYLEVVNAPYNDGDIWDSDIGDRLPLVTSTIDDREYVKVSDVAHKILNIPTDRQTKDVKNRIAAVLRSYGFENKLIYLDKIRTRVWLKTPGTIEQSQPISVPRCVPLSNPHTVPHPLYIEHKNINNIENIGQISTEIILKSNENNFELNQEMFEGAVLSVPKTEKPYPSTNPAVDTTLVPSSIRSKAVEPGQRVYIPARAIHGYYERLGTVDGHPELKARVILEDGRQTELWMLPKFLEPVRE